MDTLFTGGKPELDGVVSDASDEVRMAALIDTLNAYIEYFHGGSLEMVDFDGETLHVRMSGACQGCTLASATLHGWVEGTVKPFFPELKRVLAVE